MILKPLSTGTFISEPEINVDALADSVFYDRQSKRYRYKGGQTGQPIKGTFVSRSDVIKLQEQYLRKLTKDFIALAPRMIAGEIGLQREAAKLLKEIHMSQAIIGAGGIDRLSNSDLGTIGNLLKQQYYAGKDKTTGKPYGLKHLLKEVQRPNYSEEFLKNRLRMFAESGEISKHIVEQNQAKTQGMTLMLRVLGQAEHCPDCVAYAQLGWQPIGSLPYPKQDCQCRSNCKCSIRYS